MPSSSSTRRFRPARKITARPRARLRYYAVGQFRLTLGGGSTALRGPRREADPRRHLRRSGPVGVLRTRCFRGWARLEIPREKHRERRALAFDGRDEDIAAMGHDEVLAQGEAEARAFPLLLRGEERFEDALLYIGRHAGPGVRNDDGEEVPLLLRPHAHGAFRRRLVRVLEEVDQDLLDAERIGSTGDRAVPEFEPRSDAVLAVDLGLLHRCADDLREVDVHDVQRAWLPELQEFRGDAGGDLSLGGDLSEARLDVRFLRASRDAGGEERYVRERCVDLVRDERGDSSHGAPALALEDPALELGLVRHVPGDRRGSDDSARRVSNRGDCDGGIDLAPVLSEARRLEMVGGLAASEALGDVAHDADEQTSSACGILSQRDLDRDFMATPMTSGEIDALPRDVLFPRLEVSPECAQVAGAKPLRHDLGEFMAQELVLGISEELRRGVVHVLDSAPLIDR